VPRDGKIAKQHKLVRIVRRQKRVLRRARYPLRGSRYANHLYTDHQHVILLALRQHFRKSYRDFCDMIEVCTALLDELGLKRVPHWTTLQKFSKRADTRRLERLLLVFLQEARLRVLYLAVDSTGFSSTSASTYYTRVLESRGGRLGGHRKGVETRRYLKQTVAVETRKQLIVSVKFRRGPSNDSPDFPWVLEKVRPAGLPVKLVLADKGYDSESNHEFAQDVLGTRAVIPVRCQRPGSKMRGWHRKRQARDFDEGAYHQRAKVETVFSVEKRRMGSAVLARVTSQQHKELILRAFSYNSGRMEALFLLLIEDFYRASLACCHARLARRMKIGMGPCNTPAGK
jgi:transposase